MHARLSALALIFLAAAAQAHAQNPVTITRQTPLGDLQLTAPLLEGDDIDPIDTSVRFLAEIRMEPDVKFYPRFDQNLQFRNHRAWEDANKDGVIQESELISVCIFYTGTQERSIKWVCVPADGEQFNFTVRVGGGNPPPGPVDPPEPDPNLTEWGNWIRGQAIAVKQPEVARQIADVWGGVHSAIAAGGLKDVKSVNSAIRSGISKLKGKKGWVTLGKSIQSTFDEKVQDMANAKKFSKEVADAYDSAARYGGR